MKSFSMIVGALLATSAFVDARVGLGGCPKLTNIPFDIAMSGTNPLYFHFVDTLIFNGYTLYNLIGQKKYETFDCQKYPGLGDIFGSGFSEEEYTNVTRDYFNNEKYPFRAAFTLFDAPTKTFVLQGCLDITYLSIFLTSFLAGNNDLPSWATTLIGVSTWILKFTHFQATAVFSELQVLEITDALYTALSEALLAGAG